VAVNARRTRAAGLVALALLATATPVQGDDLPCPDAAWLGQRVVPHDVVEGYLAALEDDVVGRVAEGRVPAANLPAFRARARAALKPLLDEAFPPELLSGVAAQFLDRHYEADELRVLRTREESPLGRKLRAFEQQATEIRGQTPGARDETRDALARRTFTSAERRELEAFGASPLGRKWMGLAPALVGHFLDQLERHLTAIRHDLEPRMRGAVGRLLEPPAQP
jgi:hypothetical protein